MDGGVASKSSMNPERGTGRELRSCDGKTGGIYSDPKSPGPRREKLVQSVAIALALLMVVGAGLGVFTLVKKGTDKENVKLAAPLFMTHSPILIESEAALTSANGITGGDGTVSNPFVIQGWDINASEATVTAAGIAVSNTTSHLVIRNVNVHSGYGNSAGIALINVTNCTVEYSQSNDNLAGIVAMMCGHVVIQNNTVERSQYEGILVLSTNYTWVAHNIVVNSPNIGVELMDSTGSSVSNNTMSENSVAGLALVSCDHTSISGNIMEGNLVGLNMMMSDWSTIDNNKVVQNINYGVSMMYCQNNTLFSNVFAETYRSYGFGVMLNSSTNNTIYHNDFLDNHMSPQAYDGPSYGSSTTNNHWNMSYPIGGNFWSDYNGSDTHSGALQNQLGSDDIGDTPYAIRSSITVSDNYPLMTALTFGDAPTAYFTVTPAGGTASTVFTFNATLCWEWSNNSPGLQVRWDFNGDGIWDTGWSPNYFVQHSYAQGGEYNVSMEVRNQAGRTSNMTWHVEVEPFVIPEFTTLLVPIGLMIAVFLVIAPFRKR